MKNFFHLSDVLRAPEDNPGGGGGNPEVPPQPPATGPDIAKLLENMQTQFMKSVSDLRKDLTDANAATNNRIKAVIDDLVEGTSAPPPVPAPPSAPPQPAPTPPSSFSAPINENTDAARLAEVAYKKRLRDNEESIRNMQTQLEEARRNERSTKIEATISKAMSGLQWAEASVVDVLSRTFLQSADIDADGKVKIAGIDPVKYITDYWTGARWAQPAPVNAGSGNTGTTMRGRDGSIDLMNYNPAKVDPNSDDFRKLIEQAKKSSGMSV